MRRKNRLKVLLVILVSIFIMFSAAALLLAGFQKSEREAQKKKEAMAALESLPTAAPTGSSCDTVSQSDTEANSDTNADTKRKSKF